MTDHSNLPGVRGAAVYDVLVEECGASERWRHDFEQWVERGHHGDEYRFQGLLGFGGKVWLQSHRPPFVSCYAEDETPERLAMVERANARLTQSDEKEAK